MPIVYFGRKTEPSIEFSQSDDMIVVRSRSRSGVRTTAGPLSLPVSDALEGSVPVAEFPEAGVIVYRFARKLEPKALDARKRTLRMAPDVRFAGGVLQDPASEEPVLYTENVFVKFVDAADPDECLVILREHGLTVKEQVTYAANAYFCQVLEGTGQKVFDIALDVLKHDLVEFCHPEIIRRRARKAIFPQQWHLKRVTIGGNVINAHANVEAAHALTLGANVTIAVIDDGVDIDHPEFAGTGKIVAPRDVTSQSDDPRPKDQSGTGPELGENHGTAAAGVACAGGVLGASGVAPAARLMPIRLTNGLGSLREAEAFRWAADHGADIISCSWGPPDGRWFRPSDPLHNSVFPLPASTRLAMDYAVANGRGGKGTIILFAAGNGNEPADNDGYASYEKVIAVAACNDRGKRSIYSDFGKAVHCSYPSNDLSSASTPLPPHPAPLTPGIWTVDRIGAAGYNIGRLEDGDQAGLFSNSFGGTSSACPGAAGIVALVLSVNPDLKWHEAKDLLKRACDRIDPTEGNYDSTGHSIFYGYGRLNALSAVELARPVSRNEVIVSRRFDREIRDLQEIELTLEVAETTPVRFVSVTLDIVHPYIGDLAISLKPPQGLGPEIVLHAREGGSRQNLKRTYDTASTPALGRLDGKVCFGTWRLLVKDRASGDAGKLVSFGLTLALPPADDSRVVAETRPPRTVSSRARRPRADVA
jgi:subtilisin-like proprotein convertase family protein